MKLYVARHGETAWNVQKKVCGRTDIPLTETGMEQAKLLAEKAAELDIDIIIASPMIRAQQTAGAVSEKIGIPILTDARIIEHDFGIYEGVNWYNPGFLANKQHFACSYPGGESLMDVAHRVYGFLDELKEKYPNKNILVVCHNGVCRVLRSYFDDVTNEDFFKFSQENASFKEYEL